MRSYQVDSGPLVIGAGATIRLTRDQYKTRAHNCELIKEGDDGVVVEARVPLTFKKGEQIGLKELPKNLVDVLVPASKPKGEAEIDAVSRSEARRNAGDAAAKPAKPAPAAETAQAALV